MFEIGDVVQLKSGGPFMTVCFVENKWVRVQWFRDGVFVTDEFILEVLMKHD